MAVSVDTFFAGFPLGLIDQANSETGVQTFSLFRLHYVFFY